MNKVLVVNTAITSFNGITSVIMNYVRKTCNMMRYDFVLCGKVEKRFADELKILGDNVFLPPCSRVKKPLAYVSWLTKILVENKYDVIHVHGNSGTMYFEIHAAKKAGVPVRIAHSHSTSCKFMMTHKILKPLLNRDLTHALACSDMAGKWLFTGDYTVLPNGIDVEKFAFSQVVRDEYRKKLGLEDKLVIGHIGYMDTEKNHIFLLRVFEKLIKEHPEARLLLIGDGRLRSEIESFIKEHHFEEYIRVLGKRADVAQLYQCMDVFVLPSEFEGLGIVLIEAQTAGLPCVASTGVPQTANILKLVEYCGIGDLDIDSWCSAILNTVQNQRERCSYSNLMKETPFNIDKCVEILTDTYNYGREG